MQETTRRKIRATVHASNKGKTCIYIRSIEKKLIHSGHRVESGIGDHIQNTQGYDSQIGNKSTENNKGYIKLWEVFDQTILW